MVVNRFFTDQMRRRIEVLYPPQRIVSLVPSQTELLYDLGLGEEVVGQTLFCIHPAEMHKTKPRVGGTKNVKPEKIAGLRPDLIIGNKEENDKESITSLMEHFPVWMSDIQTLEDALEMILKVGELVGKPVEAAGIAGRIRQSFNELKPLETSLKTAYFIWRKPWMVAGNTTFINDMLQRLGLENVFSGERSRYPEISDEILKDTKLDLILLSSEPYPFKKEHIEELQIQFPDAEIMLVDGELFSWYGSRLLHSITYFQSLLSELNCAE